MKVLVLGATGQLGSNLVRALLARGDHVRALLRPIQAHQQALHHRTLKGLEIERAIGDLNDPGSLTEACRGVQVVFQAASYYPTQTIPADKATAQALRETGNLLEAVRRTSVERLVFTSTLTTIGFPKTPGKLADETCPFNTSYPDNPYLIAKVAMEDEVLKAARAGLRAVVVNPTAFFGPYDSKPTSGTQILMIAKRLMPGYIQGPVNAIDVRDVAAGLIRAAERGRVGERYILGNWNTTQKELNKLIARVAGVMAPLVPVPFALARYGSKLGDWAFRTVLRKPAPVPGFFVEMLRHMQQYDCSKAILELDYPRNPVEHAIRDALAWFRANGYLAPAK
ncbi:MAG: NAD-dependent epimerase/dehydratase family protein [Nitrospirota bacterium]